MASRRALASQIASSNADISFRCGDSCTPVCAFLTAKIASILASTFWLCDMTCSRSVVVPRDSTANEFPMSIAGIADNYIAKIENNMGSNLDKHLVRNVQTKRRKLFH